MANKYVRNTHFEDYLAEKNPYRGAETELGAVLGPGPTGYDMLYGAFGEPYDEEMYKRRRSWLEHQEPGGKTYTKGK